MVKCNSDGIIFLNAATSQDILNLAQAIATASDIRLDGGYRISKNIIHNMISAMDEATASYRKSIKEAQSEQ